MSLSKEPSFFKKENISANFGYFRKFSFPSDLFKIVTSFSNFKGIYKAFFTCTFHIFFFKSRTSKTFLILSFDMNFFSEEIFIKIIIITCLQNSVPPVCFVCFEFKAFVQLLLLKDRRHGGDFVVGYSLFISLS